MPKKKVIKKVPEVKEVIPPTPTPKPTKKPYFEPKVTIKYSCPDCKKTHETTPIDNAIIIKDALCSKCLCLMSKTITRK